MIDLSLKKGVTNLGDKVIGLEYMLYAKGVLAKEKARRKGKNLLADNRGMAVVEIVLIIAVIVGVLYVFKDKIGALIENIFSKLDGKTDEFMSET